MTAQRARKDSNMNRIIIKGRVAREIEIKTTGSGKTVGNFSVAVDKGFGENKSADFFRVTAWEKTAEFVRSYFPKGREILIEGRMESSKSADNSTTYWDVIAQRVEFCGSESDAVQQGNPPVASTPDNAGSDSDYPFF